MSLDELRDKMKSDNTGFGIFNKVSAHSIHGDDVRLMSGSGAIKLPIRPNVGGRNGSSLIQIGSSMFSYPAWKLKENADGSYAGIHAVEDLYRSMGIQHNFSGMSRVARKFNNLSRSTVGSSLGVDWSLAVHRSHMVDIGDVKLGFDYGNNNRAATKSISEHLEHVRGLFSTYSMSGGHGIGNKDKAIYDYYSGLVNALEGKSLKIDGQQRNVYISSVKDMLFRGHSFASVLAPQEMGFGLGMKDISKSIHGGTKVTPIDISRLKHLKIKHRTPAASALIANKEHEFFNMMGRFNGMKGPSGDANYVGRLGIDVGYVIGRGNSLQGIAPSGMAEAAIEGGNRMFRVMSSIDRQNFKRVTRKIDISRVDSGYATIGRGGVEPLLHPRLAPIVESLRGGTTPLGMTQLDNGFFGLDRPLYLKRSDMMGYTEIPGVGYGKKVARSSKRYNGIYLGTSTPGFIPTNQGDVFRAAVSEKTKATALRVHGVKVSNGEVHVQFSEYFNPKNRGPQGRIESPVMLGNVRGTMSSTNSQLGFDALARAEDFGLKVVNGELTASPQFITKNVIPHLAHRARSAGKLKEFAQFSGLDYVPRSGSVDEYVAFNKNVNPGGVWLPQFLKKLTNNTEDIGLGKSAGLIKQSGSNYVIDSGAVKFTKNTLGEDIGVLGLHGQELIRRASMYERSKIGRGAFTVRLQETMPILLSQWKNTSNNKKLSAAYGSLYNHFLDGIKLGTKASIAGGTSHNVGEQVAGLLMSPFGGGAAPGGVLKGIKHSGPEFTLEQWYKSAKAGVHKPLATSIRAAEDVIARGGISGSILEGTIHSLTSGLPIMLKLPKAIQSAIAVGDKSQYINQSSVYFPSDVLLGTGPTHSGVHFSKYGGHKRLGLAREKATIFSGLFEEMAQLERRGGDLAKYIPSEALLGRMSGFATNSRIGLIGKYGGMYHNLAYRPKSAMYSPVSAMSGLGLDDQSVVGVHPEHFIDLLNKAKYTPAEIQEIMKEGKGIYGMYSRQPIHSEGNLQFKRIIPISGAHVDRDRIYTGRRSQSISFGDFDHDTAGLVIERSQQQQMKVIHEHQSKLLEIYSRTMDDADRKGLEAAKTKMLGGFTITDLVGSAEEERQKIVEAIASRYRGAAGGGASVGAIDMFYRRLSSLGRHVSDGGSEFIKTLTDLDHGTGTKAALMASDKNFLSYLSTLQEVGVYGTLKKGATGFGSEEMPVIQALATYGKDPTLDNMISLRESLLEGLKKQFKEGNFKIGQQTEALGITSDEFAKGELSHKSIMNIMDIMMGESGKHGGIATLARVRQVLKDAGEIDPYEDLFRGQHITTPELLNQKLSGLAPNMVGTTYGSLEAIEAEAYVQSNPAVHKGVLQLTAAANTAVKAKAAKKVAASEANATFGSRAVAGISSFIKDTKELTNTPWGNKMLLGVGALAALGAVDAIFGKDDSEENLPTTFVPSGGSPLPPSPRLGPADGGMPGPSANVIRNRHAHFGRIERPGASRQAYDISAVTDAGSDFGTSMAAYMGSAHNRPTHSSYVVDRRSNRRDSSYYDRRQIQSSF